MKLDQTDFDIIGHLQNNARVSNKELAAAIHLSPSSCLERVRRLSNDGVFRGFHAQVDESALGIGLEALIGVRLTRHRRDLVDGFCEHVMALPEVVAFYHVAGAHDFLVHVAVRDAGHLRDLAMDGFTTLEEVEHMETNLIFQQRRKASLPCYRRDE